MLSVVLLWSSDFWLMGICLLALCYLDLSGGSDVLWYILMQGRKFSIAFSGFSLHPSFLRHKNF